MYSSALGAADTHVNKFENDLIALLSSNRSGLEGQSVQTQINTLKAMSQKAEQLQKVAVDAIVNDNKVFISTFKKIAHPLGEIAKDKLDKVTNSVQLGINVKSKEYWKAVLSNVNYFNEKKMNSISTKAIEEKVMSIHKHLYKPGVHSSQSEYVDGIANMEYFCDVLLSALQKVESLSYGQSQKQESWLMENERESRVLNVLKETAKYNILVDAIKELECVDNLKIGKIKISLGINSDNDSLVRAKKALKGAKESLDSLMGEMSLPGDDFSLAEMYLQDALDHIKLSKSCYVNDSEAMYENSSLDTSSRELIDDSLWTYLRSDKFFEAIDSQKKLKKKMKVK
jgi:hypothetical protein